MTAYEERHAQYAEEARQERNDRHIKRVLDAQKTKEYFERKESEERK